MSFIRIEGQFIATFGIGMRDFELVLPDFGKLVAAFLGDDHRQRISFVPANLVAQFHVVKDVDGASQRVVCALEFTLDARWK